MKLLFDQHSIFKLAKNLADVFPASVQRFPETGNGLHPGRAALQL